VLIRTRLWVIAVLPLVLMLLVWLVCWATAHRTQAASGSLDMALRIRQGGYELDILTRECQLNPGGRTFTQWRRRFDSLVVLVNEWSGQHAGSAFVDLFRNETEALERLFTEFIDLAPKAGSSSQHKARDVLRANLSSQMCSRSQEIVGLGSRLAQQSQAEAARTTRSGYWAVSGVVLLFGVVLFAAARFLGTRIEGPLGALSEGAQEIGRGKLRFRQDIKGNDELARLARAFGDMAENLRGARDQTDAQNWISRSRTELDECMRGEKDVSTLCQDVIAFLAERLHAQVGTILLVTEDRKQLTLVGSYAYTDRKRSPGPLAFGEGLAGQAAQSGKRIVVTDLPEDCITATSSTGEVRPRQLLCFPLPYEGEVKGVVELGSLDPFTEQELAFLDAVGASMAIAIHSAQSRERLKSVLERSQALTEELQTQQEEMEATNEELREKTAELEAQQDALNGQARRDG